MRISAARAPLLVGIVVVASLAALVYMVTKVKTTLFTDQDSYSVSATFDDVTGLVENSDVTMVGIAVGVIESIDRVQMEDTVKALVVIRVQKDVVLYSGIRTPEGILRGAASVVRKQSSILGDFYLSLSSGAFGDPLQDGDGIPIVIGTTGVESLVSQMENLGRIYPSIERILVNVERISESMAEAVGTPEGKRNLTELVSNISEITEQSRKIVEQANTVAAGIESLVTDGTVDRIAGNIEAATVDARDIADRVQRIVSAGDIQELVDKLTASAEQMNTFGTQLAELVKTGISPRVTQLDRIFQNLEKFSSDLSDFAQTNSAALTDTIGNFRDFSDRLVQILGTQEGQDVQSTIESVRNTLYAAQSSIEKLDESLENVRAITADLREGKGTVGRLLTDDRLIEQVEEIISDTRGFVKSYSLMQTEIEVASSYFLGEENAKNILSLRFRPREDKYYLVQLVDDPRGLTRDLQVVTQSDDPTKTPEVTESIETTTHALKFSFQFARRFYFVTGRFGILESTGGLGLDFDFFRDRLQFQFDLFDFTLNENPRLRSQVLWEVFQHVFVAGGADDLLNDKLRDYYLSARLRFTDDDLKALLFAAPSISP